MIRVGPASWGRLARRCRSSLIEVGIAEQNLVGIAAGLSAAGKKAFAVSPACFLTARALEQIKNDVCYSDVPATVVGISAGVSYGALGSTHHSLHDLAALRAIHNITVIVPADNFETREAVRAAARAEHPVYLRFGKAPMLSIHGPDATFEVGKAIVLREGTDLAFIATGETVVHALLAAGTFGRTRRGVPRAKHAYRQTVGHAGGDRSRPRVWRHCHRRRTFGARRTWAKHAPPC